SLIISEKPKSALRIATVLSDGKFKTQKIGKIPVYAFGEEKEPNLVIGLKGHIVSLDYPKQYNSWDKTALRELIHAPIEKYISERAIVNALEKIAKNVTKVIIATDYDREGELIGVEALELLKKFDLELKRARFSALTPQELKKAFSELTEIDYNLAKSSEARQIIDLAWGAVLTRFISLASERTGKDFLSVGRVQTPLLKLIVAREKEIQKFVPKPYWGLNAKLEFENSQFIAYYLEGNFWEYDRAKAIYEKLKTQKTGKVLELEQERHEEAMPSPFNTTTFLQASSFLGISAPKAMKIAESLYQAGLISYPRTDNTVYPKSLELRTILSKLVKLIPEAEKILRKDIIIPSRGKKFATDHPPIHPVDIASKSKLSYEEWKLYELIVRRFIATLAGNALSEITNVKIDIGGEKFIAHGYKILEEGWREYYPYLKVKEILIPQLKSGEIVRLLKLELKESKTKPPQHYSQGSLIQLMESLGLGTKSTRHEIIQKLYARDYIRGLIPRPTKAGIAVTEALENYAQQVTSPEMTSKLEKEMDEIAEGKRVVNEVVRESKQLLENVLNQLEENKFKIGESIKKALKEQAIIGKCPVCKSEMIIMLSKIGKRFAGCTNFPACNNSYPLPPKGRIIAINEECEICNAPKVKIIFKKQVSIQCINLNCSGKREKQKY
ncbi:MAG: DNA topoisomerase I, partial [Candidatus Thermoplasmatota archaeon]